MTAKRDLKKRVRARQQKTGESYTAARAHVVSEQEPVIEKEPVIEVEEALDLEADVARLGFRCRVTATSKLANRVDPIAVLERLREALDATDGDPTTDVLRAVARGERPLIPKRSAIEWRDDFGRFLKRVRAGIGGTSDLGNLIALQMPGTTVVAYSYLAPMFGRMLTGPRASPPSITLTLLDELKSPVHVALYGR
jgi:hypothetical protein